jgi:hypothetical protein
MKRMIAALALIALLVTAAPAAAKPKTLYYDGETLAGNSLSFAMTGKRIHDVSGYVTSTCVPTHGAPRVSADEYNPPGSELDVNYSYEEVNFGAYSELVQSFYICQGNDSFRFVV